MCSVFGCPKDKVWGVVSGGRLFRLTFSRSLAERIAREIQAETKQFRFVLGAVLKPGQRSSSGLYALVSKQKGIVLRISMFQEIAEMQLDPEFRYLQEVWLMS